MRFQSLIQFSAAAVVGGLVVSGCAATGDSVTNQPQSTPSSACATGGGAADTCVVGDTGPGGGTVFYVNESNPTGSRYMEAAPATWNGGGSDPTGPWCWNDPTLIAGTFGTAIGTGKTNTDHMVADGACTLGPANSVRAYATAGAPAGAWSLPSLQELNALDVSGVGGLVVPVADYWSSSQVDAGNAWLQVVGQGGGPRLQIFGTKDFPTLFARPVRAF